MSTSHPHTHAVTGHGHHDHDHHDHGHSHGQVEAFAPVQPAAPSFSLLALSVWQRLAGAAAISAGLWLAVWWALR